MTVDVAGNPDAGQYGFAGGILDDYHNNSGFDHPDSRNLLPGVDGRNHHHSDCPEDELT